MQKRFDLYLFPYLKKYVEKMVLENERPPYKIDEDSLLGKQFMSLIKDARKTDMRGDKKIQPSALLSVVLSDAMAKRSPSPGKLQPINFFLDKLFKASLIIWIKSSDIAGTKPFVSSKQFLKYLCIDESEYTHDAAYKVWTRYKSIGYKRKIINDPRGQNTNS